MGFSTLLRIAVSEARVGLFVHALDGAWLDNPLRIGVQTEV